MRSACTRSPRRISCLTTVLVVALGTAAGTAGCAHSKAAPWQKSAGVVAVTDWKEDGGESIAPKPSSAKAAVENSADKSASNGTITLEVVEELIQIGE